jgi:hypothetical protein
MNRENKIKGNNRKYIKEVKKVCYEMYFLNLMIVVHD